MKNLFLISALTLIVSACSPSNKTDHIESKKDNSPRIEKREYSYVETVEQRNADFSRTEVERNPVKIVATSDTAAFMIAYRNYCITEAMYLSNSRNPYPKTFRLYDDTGADVTASILKLCESYGLETEQRAKAIRAEVFKIYEVKEEY